MNKSRHILFISSWYPNRNNQTHGIFNRHFAEAASLYNRISVLHICSDENISDKIELTESIETEIYTVTAYYKRVTTQTPLFSQLKKRKRILEATEKAYEQILHKNGNPDLIQLNVIVTNGLAALFLSEKHDLPLVINEGWTG